MQIEQEKLTKQLDVLIHQKKELEQIDISLISERVFKGSLVKCAGVFLFISIGLGKINVDNETVVVLSPSSPLGKKLLGLRAGQQAEMNGVTYPIESIL